MEVGIRNLRYLGVNSKICKLVVFNGRSIKEPDCIYFFKYMQGFFLFYFYMKEKIIKNLEWVATFAALMAIIYGSYTISKNVVEETVKSEQVEVVLDAGHGGSDPGKIGINDVLEKDVNLSIVLKVRELLENDNISVILTRENDQCLGEDGKELSKVADMKRRVEIMNDVQPKVVVSVHQNSYTSAEIRGAQVFYFTSSEKSKQAAEILQEELRAVDPSNTREIKENNTYYLLKKTEVPAVIVECGFLSNPEEAEKLATEDYQNKMAEAIVKGIKSYLVMVKE